MKKEGIWKPCIKMLLQLERDYPNNAIDEHLYIADVVDNEDPKQLCRVRIRIPEIHGDLADEHCPWAAQFKSSFLGSGEELSSYSVPRKGTKVGVIHHRGDVYSPLYITEPYTASSESVDVSSRYPDSYGFNDSDENFVHVDMGSDQARIEYNGDVYIKVNQGEQDGDVVVQSEGGQYIKSGDDFVVIADGNVVTKSGDNAVVQASKGVLLKAPLIRLVGPVISSGPMQMGGPVSVGGVSGDSFTREDALVKYSTLKKYLDDVRDLINEIKSKHNLHISGHTPPILPPAQTPLRVIGSIGTLSNDAESD